MGQKGGCFNITPPFSSVYISFIQSAVGIYAAYTNNEIISGKKITKPIHNFAIHTETWENVFEGSFAI